jgi:hypothetical protein
MAQSFWGGRAVPCRPNLDWLSPRGASHRGEREHTARGSLTRQRPLRGRLGRAWPGVSAVPSRAALLRCAAREGTAALALCLGPVVVLLDGADLGEEVLVPGGPGVVGGREGGEWGGRLRRLVEVPAAHDVP